MNNKKIKADTKSGTFTTVTYNILRDTRINSNAKILLIEILSDSETFELSQTLYCNRQGWDKKQFQRAIEELVNAGYIRKTQISKDTLVAGKKKKGSDKILYFYTVSEYGNLKTTPTQEEAVAAGMVLKPFEEVIPTIEEVTPKEDTKTYEEDYNEFKNWVKSEVDKFINQSTLLGTIAEKKTSVEKIYSYFTNKMLEDEQLLITKHTVGTRILHANNTITNNKIRYQNQEYLQ